MATVNKEMSIIDVLRLDDTTSEVFLSYGMTCLTCPFATAESLAEASAAHGVDAGKLVDDLNAHLAKKG
jgi:hybrid cluster-associated redox disulfide protein